jgi:DNA recombination protein RmuC
MEYLVVYLIGILIVIGIVLIVYLLLKRSYQQAVENLTHQMKDTFNSLSLNALSVTSGELLKLSRETLAGKNEENRKDLDSRKEVIDLAMQEIAKNLKNMEKVVTDFEKDRAEKFGQLDTQLKNVTSQTTRLNDVTGKLQQALSSSKARGQWGERIAEDVLRAAGFVENINYQKQVTLEGSTRPDFTFLLPQGLKLNMDVKFPLDNYMKYFNAVADSDKERHKVDFLKDVRNRIKEVTGREYISPEQNTVDYMIVFIPNEQVYSFIQENDRTLIDDAFAGKVLLCSPITLYAILSIIRHAVDTFNLTQTADQILSQLGLFNKQWALFCKSMEKVGSRLDDAHNEYSNLVSTRRRQLEKPLERIEDLRKQRGIPEAALTDTDLKQLEDGDEGKT